MIRTIDIKGRTGRFDTPSFLLTDNEDLTIKINVKEYRAGKYVVKLVNGDLQKTVYLGKDMLVNVSADWLNKGGGMQLSFFFELYDNAGSNIIIPAATKKEDKTGFFIEPLKLEKMPNGWSACGWLQMIEIRLSSLLGKVVQVERKLQKFEEEGVPLLAASENEENKKGE